MVFTRQASVQRLPYLYRAASGLRNVPYQVVSTGSCWVAGYLTVVCYVVVHRGRLVRCWVS